MGKRFWILFFITLALFSGGGFFLGYSGLIQEFRKVNSIELTVLTEKGFLFPPWFQTALETKVPVRFKMIVAEDPDAFLERASTADLLWGRQDWILKTELHLKDFKKQKRVQELLNRTLSADFFDPEETSSTILPLLWTLPLIRVRADVEAKNLTELTALKGEVHWPFWGLNEFLPGFPNETKVAAQPREASWWLYPSSVPLPESSQKQNPWFPEKKIRPLVIALAFVENDRTSSSLKDSLVEAWLEPALLAKLSADSKMAFTLVQGEERLPPWQRASALRQIGLSHLEHP